MIDLTALSKVTEIARRRREAARLVLTRAERAVAQSQETLKAKIELAKKLTNSKAKLKTAAERAFCKSPQAAAAVSLLIEKNAAHDKRARDAWHAVEETQTTLDKLQKTRNEARTVLVRLERDFDARNGLSSRLRRSEAQHSELREEATVSDERAAFLQARPGT